MLFEATFNDALHTVRNGGEKELLGADLDCHTALSNGWPSFSKWKKLSWFSFEQQEQVLPVSEGCKHLPLERHRKDFLVLQILIPVDFQKSLQIATCSSPSLWKEIKKKI